MSEDEQDDDVLDSIERINQARQERSDAAWRPFEQKWAAEVSSAYEVASEVKETEALWGTPAEAGVFAHLARLFAAVAKEAARTAHERDFETRRGFRVLGHALGRAHLCVAYNNNPYAGLPTRRDKELKEYRGWLAEMGVDELGYAEHPDLGRDEGYSYALLLGCVDGSESVASGQYEAAWLRSLAQMPWPAHGFTLPEER
jgi:hypothetical protein